MLQPNSYVNVDNSHYSGNFSSNEIPGLPGLAGAKYNVDAANGYVPGICVMKGGKKKIKRKIKNITKKYKMSKTAMRTRKTKLSKKYKLKHSKKHVKKHRKHSKKTLKRSRSRRKYHHKQKGGTSTPYQPSYSVGGIISSNELALANPPPFNTFSNCQGNAYNHFLQK